MGLVNGTGRYCFQLSYEQAKSVSPERKESLNTLAHRSNFRQSAISVSPNQKTPNSKNIVGRSFKGEHAVQPFDGNRNFVMFALEIALEALIVFPDELFRADYAGISEITGSILEPFHPGRLKILLSFGFHDLGVDGTTFFRG